MLENQNLKVHRNEAPHFYSHYHYHKELQITAFIKGEGTMLIGNALHRFMQGDVIMIGENTPHLLQKSPNFGGKAITINVYFSKDLFGLGSLYTGELKDLSNFLNQTKKGILVYNLKAAELREGLNQIYLSDDPFTRITCLFNLINQFRKEKDKVWLNELSQSSINEEVGQRLDAVYHYTLKNLKNNIKLEEVADVANLSVSRFCRVFKKHSGKTYIEFLQVLRIEEACSKLINTDQNISEIAFNTGFKNLSNFNKTFKTVKGNSPSEVRKRMKNLN